MCSFFEKIEYRIAQLVQNILQNFFKGTKLCLRFVLSMHHQNEMTPSSSSSFKPKNTASSSSSTTKRLPFRVVSVTSEVRVFSFIIQKFFSRKMRVDFLCARMTSSASASLSRYDKRAINSHSISFLSVKYKRRMKTSKRATWSPLLLLLLL